MAANLGAPAFAELQDECDKLGMRVLVTTITVGKEIYPVVEIPLLSGESFSRTVQKGESIDRCARIMLDALRTSKILPPRNRSGR